MSDFLGRRNTVLAAFVIFTTSSIGCGFAQTSQQIIALRTLQGIGGAGLYSLSVLIVIEIATDRMLPLISVYAGMIVAVGGVLGPVLGGVITHYASWRWIFWMK